MFSQTACLHQSEDATYYNNKLCHVRVTPGRCRPPFNVDFSIEMLLVNREITFVIVDQHAYPAIFDL